MAVFRTDRERRILGDRLVARRAEFVAIDEAVGRVLDRFAEAHRELLAALERRRREEGEDSRARRRRDEAAAAAWKHYRWAYHRVDALLAPSWDDAPEPWDVSQIRDG